jgi:hypothetical protein
MAKIKSIKKQKAMSKRVEKVYDSFEKKNFENIFISSRDK